MKGLLLEKPRQLRVVESAPGEPGEGQVLVKIDNVGLCGSDLHLYQGTYRGPHRYPMYFGHEWAGTVAAVGPGVEGVRVGDRVTGDCSQWCGECEVCRTDRNLCRQIEKFGITVDGASRQCVPVEAKYLYVAPPDADLTVLSLAEPLAVGLRMIARVRQAAGGAALAGKRALVLGAGPIGLGTALSLLRLHGCQEVAVADVVEARLQAAVELGAQRAPDGGAVSEGGGDYRSLYGSAQYDLVFETTGVPQCAQRALVEARPLGCVALLGFLPPAEFDLRLVTVKALTVVGAIGGTGNFEQAIELITRYPNDVRRLVAARIPYTEAARAFSLAEGRSHVGKIQIVLND